VIRVFALGSYCASHRSLQVSPDVVMEVENVTVTCTICCDDVEATNYESTLSAQFYGENCMVPQRLYRGML
jgi:hypothetical protein